MVIYRLGHYKENDSNQQSFMSMDVFMSSLSMKLCWNDSPPLNFAYIFSTTFSATNKNRAIEPFYSKFVSCVFCSSLRCKHRIHVSSSIVDLLQSPRRSTTHMNPMGHTPLQALYHPYLRKKEKSIGSVSVFACQQLDVSQNSGTPKSSIWIGFSIINHPFWGTTILGNPQLTLDANLPRSSPAENPHPVMPMAQIISGNRRGRRVSWIAGFVLVPLEVKKNTDSWVVKMVVSS